MVYDNYITNEVFSFWLNMTIGNSSFVKFGGWDKNATFNQTEPVLLHTAGEDTFALVGTGYALGDQLYTDANL